jgi:hypothetical protein
MSFVQFRLSPYQARALPGRPVRLCVRGGGAAFNFPLPGWRGEVPVDCIFVMSSQANTLLNVLEYKG